ncbi:hypothetical protein ACT9XH_00340 [Methanococcoides methylutens]|uniref:hypothetical protein n=1 Tax=Methanococcoides methylutens TaxID=2226 RepID=UPI004043A74B
MANKKRIRLVPYDMVSPGFEAIYTGKKSSSEGEKEDINTTITSDNAGNEIIRWPVFSWTFPGQEKDWDEEVKHINIMQSKLGTLDDNTRQIRAHIGSLVPCDSGFPVTVDELLNAIGFGKLNEPSFHNGCWNCGAWWEQKTTQPLQMQSMKTIHDVLTGYLAARDKEELIKRYPHATGFINRTYEWLGSVDKLSEVQKLMFKRMLLTIDLFVKSSCTEPSSLLSEASMLQWIEDGMDLFSDDKGSGASLDAEISKKAGLPKIHSQLTEKEFKENLKGLDDPQKRELYKTCVHIASGVYSSSDCHHNTFRYIEGWIHGIGTGKLSIPTRKAGAEKERLGNLLFGYVLGLDKWLVGIPMQLLLLDLGHLDLGFDPKNEILRVYAYLDGERTPVKEWLAACLWHNLMYSFIDANYPAGLVRHKHLLEDAGKAGISLREWMDSVLGNDS